MDVKELGPCSVVEAGARRIVNGKDVLPPPMYLDRELRVVKISGRAYPLEHVRFYDVALTPIKKPPPLDLEVFTHGKHARSAK
jgi:hypothetical protein